MALTYNPPGELESIAPDFSLPGVDGKVISLKEFARDARAVVVVFMCNHCPYVKAVDSRINALAQEFANRGVRWVAINSNDSENYPEDGFEEMKARARERGYGFPYLRDETQEVARAYGAVCTPDFFLYAQQAGTLALKYRGRLDNNWKEESKVTQRDLAQAIESVLQGRALPNGPQPPSMGCSIKWKTSRFR